MEMKIIEDRPLLKLYKKSEVCRSEGVLMTEFHRVEDKYIPVKYTTPSNKKYAQDGYGVRYVKKEDVLNY